MIFCVDDNLENILKGYGITKYTVNSDESIDCHQNVYLNFYSLIKIPFKFNRVYGDFICNGNNLTNLENAPKYVQGLFDCSDNIYLTSLEGCPKYIGSDFISDNNMLKSIEGCPDIIFGNFIITQSSYLESLIGLPSSILGNLCLDMIPIDRINVECDIKGSIYIDNTCLDDKISDLNQYYLKMLFKYGLDYNIFNEDGSINVKQLNFFIDDFK